MKAYAIISTYASNPEAELEPMLILVERKQLRICIHYVINIMHGVENHLIPSSVLECIKLMKLKAPFIINTLTLQIVFLVLSKRGLKNWR